MARSGSSKDRYNFLIDRSAYEDFSVICDELGLVRSKKVEILMKKFIEENKDTLKRIKGK